ncbi:MAG: leucine-rich repeat domain-containing protein [Microbacter sp.]
MMLQATVSKTVNVTAGGLSTALTSTELSTVTNLTITGTIDARDFVTMRDNMPSLAVLDISAVNIAAYNGNGGTFTNTSYPVNILPEYSFYIQANGQGKTSLTSITIPSSVTSIGDWAFFNCNGLTSITIPSSVTSIGGGVFADCYHLTSIIIPSSVTSIGGEAFVNCNGLTSITIPSSVTSIGGGVFQGCVGLTSIAIPSSITSIGYGVFEGCSGLTSITIPNSVTSIGDHVFDGCVGLTSVTIPNSITSIGGEAFSGSGLTSITIPSSVTSIGNDVFADCTRLTPVTIPSSVTSIGNDVFAGCTRLTSVTIPNSITSIGDGVFQGCSGLTSITIPNSITSIGNWAFQRCSGLASIYAYPATPIDLSSSSDVFYSVNTSTCILYVPSGSLSAYKAAYQWKDFTNIVEMTNTAVSTTTVNPIYLYPNPVTDGFFIKGLNGNDTLTLLDISGKTLLTKQISGNEYVSISTYPKGLYIVKIITAEGVIERKVLKE